MEWEKELNKILWNNFVPTSGEQENGEYSIPVKQKAQIEIEQLIRSLIASAEARGAHEAARQVKSAVEQSKKPIEDLRTENGLLWIAIKDPGEKPMSIIDADAAINAFEKYPNPSP